MIRGVLEVDGFGYDWENAHPIILDPATGETRPDESVELRVLVIRQPPGAGPDIRIIFNLADFEEFQRKTVGASSIVVTRQMPPVPAIFPAGNGHRR